MSSPIGYPQGNAYPMFSSTSAGDTPVAVGKEKQPLYASTSSDGGNDFGLIRLPGAHQSRLRGVTLFGPESLQPTPTVVPQSGVTVSASGFITLDGEPHYFVTATNSGTRMPQDHSM